MEESQGVPAGAARPKFCRGCDQWKLRADFYFVKATNSYSAKCRECKKAAARKWQSENPDRARAHRKAYRQRSRGAEFESRTGMSLTEYASRYDDQRGKCPICRSVYPRLAVIAPGQPLVCSSCLRGLRAFACDPARLRRAAYHYACYNTSSEQTR